jgi:hypothetical protein
MTDFIDDDEEVNEGYDVSNSPHVADIRKEAIECMEIFFADKKYWAGGNISKTKLFSEENIQTAMSTNILDALDVAYECLAEQEPQSYTNREKGWAIELCYEVLKSCPRRMIPKCNAGGILLVYLSICQGVDYIDKLKKFNSKLSGSYNTAI